MSTNINGDTGVSKIQDNTVSNAKVADDAIGLAELAAHAEAEANAWKGARQSAYPSWQDQLDKQYHDSVDGTTTWEDAIAKVKEDNPKPE